MLESPVEQGVLGGWDVGARCLDLPMSSTYAEPLARLTEALDEIASYDPVFRTTTEKQDLMVALSGGVARAHAQPRRARAAAAAGAEPAGAGPPATWLADATRDAHGRVRADARLA